MKKTIDINSLSVESVLKLFDSLVLPVLTYGIEVWFWNTEMAAILSGKSSLSIKCLSRDSLEKIQMQIIKWTLNVHKRSSNIGCYGETGRQPIGVKCRPQILRYLSNLERSSVGIDEANATGVPLVILAFLEQQKLLLRWYSNIKGIYTRHSTASSAHIESIKRRCSNEFIQFWKHEKTKPKRYCK